MKMTRDEIIKNKDKLRDANLRYADLGGVDLSGAYLYNADLRGAYLYNADLRGANLYNVDLSEADLRGANLSEADLRGANLREADLSDTNLNGADLRGANLRDAKLRDVNLHYASLRNADLRGAKLPSPTMLLLAQWGEVSDDLCIELMRYDASNHPQPELFDKWIETTSCPYDDCRWQRAANFREKHELYSPIWTITGLYPAKSALELAEMLIAECTETGD